MLRRQILPIRNVNLTLLPIDRIVLILKAELFLRTTGARCGISKSKDEETAEECNHGKPITENRPKDQRHAD